MPLSEIQSAVFAVIFQNRSDASHLAGASAIHASANSFRYSGDIDLFHDSEAAVAEAFTKDRADLEKSGFKVRLLLSQPGFIRARVTHGDEEVLMDWAHDSAWRFMPTVSLEGLGHVFHPVDLAVNKVLALGGRDEPRDWLDVLYLDEKVLSLGAMVWAAVGKDPGMNPEMLLGLLSRKGKIQQRDLDRLLLTPNVPVLDALHQQWSSCLESARRFIRARPPTESGRLYADPKTGRFFAPEEGDVYELREPQRGGILPRIRELENDVLRESLADDSHLMEFFGRPVLR